MIYIVAIYLTQIVLVYRVEGQIGTNLEKYFGSVPVPGLLTFLLPKALRSIDIEVD